MAVASLVLGIVSFVFALIPFCGIIAFIPAIIGFILGLVGIFTNKSKGQGIGMAIAGTILSALAIIFMLFWFFIAGIGMSSVDANRVINNIVSEYSTLLD